MLVFIAIILSAAIIGIMYYSAQSRETSFQRKYELVSDLRQLVSLCRQHRSASHQALLYDCAKSHQTELVEKDILELCEHLIATAHFDNKPIYRILQTKLKKLVSGWQEMSISQNQMAHGKSIRHCLFLIDEVVLAWLIESQKSELSDEYNLSWQQVIDGLDALTQFRLSVQEIHSDNGLARLKLHAAAINRRLNQLALISPLAVASPACSLVSQQLDEISQCKVLEFSPEQLYQISTDASLVIFNAYDALLSELAETIYRPFPSLTISV